MPDSSRQLTGCTRQPEFGFQRDLKLTEARDFSRVFKGPDARYPLPGLLVLVKKNGLDHPRLGMAISRKHLARATARNRIKRMVRESFRLCQAQLAGWDIVVVSRKGISGIAHSKIKDKLQKTWQQIKPCFGP